MFEKIINYIFLFVVFSVIGWTIESTYRSIGEKKIVNTGFLNGPLCPIYGTGCLVFHIFLVPIADKLPLEKSVWLVLLLGVVLADTVEYITSVLMEKLFHARWWDYSNNFLNINGRICFKHSCYWAVFAFLYTYIISPLYIFAMSFIPQQVRTVLVFIILAVFIVDLILTVKAAADINKMMTKLSGLKQSVYYAAEVIRSKAEDIKDTAENKYQELIAGKGSLTDLKEEKFKQYYEIKAQYEKLKSAGSRSASRLIRNFGQLGKIADDTLTDIEKTWQDIKSKFKDNEDEMM